MPGTHKVGTPRLDFLCDRYRNCYHTLWKSVHDRRDLQEKKITYARGEIPTILEEWMTLRRPQNLIVSHDVLKPLISDLRSNEPISGDNLNVMVTIGLIMSAEIDSD